MPWHRVISSSGAIADRGDGGEAAARQAQRLQEEGVTVVRGRGEGVTVDFGHANPNAKYRVDMRVYGWFPDEVRLEGYEDEEGDGQRREAIQEDEEDSDLSELTEEEE